MSKEKLVGLALLNVYNGVKTTPDKVNYFGNSQNIRVLRLNSLNLFYYYYYIDLYTTELNINESAHI